MDDLSTLTIFTKALLDKGLDYEVTLKGSEVDVRLFDRLTGDTIGNNKNKSLEEALASVLATVASQPAHGYVGLSKL